MANLNYLTKFNPSRVMEDRNRLVLMCSMQGWSAAMLTCMCRYCLTTYEVALEYLRSGGLQSSEEVDNVSFVVYSVSYVWVPYILCMGTLYPMYGYLIYYVWVSYILCMGTLYPMYGYLISYVWVPYILCMGTLYPMYGYLISYVWVPYIPCMGTLYPMYGYLISHVWVPYIPCMGTLYPMYGYLISHVWVPYIPCMGTLYPMYGYLISYVWVPYILCMGTLYSFLQVNKHQVNMSLLDRSDSYNPSEDSSVAEFFAVSIVQQH